MSELKYRPEKSTLHTCVFTTDQETIVLQRNLFFTVIKSPDDPIGMIFESHESLPEILPISSSLIENCLKAWEKAREENQK